MGSRTKSCFSDSDKDDLESRNVYKSRKRKVIVETDEEDTDALNDDVNYGISSDDESNAEESEDENGEDNDDDKDDGKSSAECPICLVTFTDQIIAVPESCKHMFCVGCIQEWIKNVNNCPVDRKKFNSISILLMKDGPVLEELYVADKVIADVYEDPPTNCQVCAEFDREECMLLCDECDSGYHMDCLDPPLEFVPIEEWFCVECQPAPRVQALNISVRARRQTPESEYIGNEEELLNIFERREQMALNERAMDPDAGLRPRARTVASSRRGRGRSSGRGCSRGRRRGSHSRGSTTRKSTSTGKRKRKVKEKKLIKNKDSLQGKKAIEKAKQKVMQKQIQKFRERFVHASESKSEPEAKSFSLFGNKFGLDYFYGDPEETYRKQEEAERYHGNRSAIVNTTDVIGSIISGFGSLNPDDVIVERDGTVKPLNKCKKRKISDVIDDSSNMSDDGKDVKKKCRKASTDSISGIVKSNYKRRKIKFTDDDDDSDGVDNNNGNNIENAQSNAMHDGINSFTGCNENVEDVKEDNAKETDKIREVLREKMRKNLLAMKEEKLKTEKIKAECERMKEQHTDTNFKTLTLLDNVAKFKIPKVKQENKDLGLSVNEGKDARIAKRNDSGIAKRKDDGIAENRGSLVRAVSCSVVNRRNKVDGESHIFDRNIVKMTEEGTPERNIKRIRNEVKNISTGINNKNTKTVATSKTTAKTRVKNYLSTESKVAKINNSTNKRGFFINKELERKVRLYQEGKYKKPKDLCNRKKVSTVSKTEAQSVSALRSVTFALSKPCSNTATSKSISDNNKRSVLKNREVLKKTISIDDYKNRKLYENIFGDANLEDNLKVKETKDFTAPATSSLQNNDFKFNVLNSNESLQPIKDKLVIKKNNITETSANNLVIPADPFSHFLSSMEEMKKNKEKVTISSEVSKQEAVNSSSLIGIESPFSVRRPFNSNSPNIPVAVVSPSFRTKHKKITQSHIHKKHNEIKIDVTDTKIINHLNYKMEPAKQHEFNNTSHEGNTDSSKRLADKKEILNILNEQKKNDKQEDKPEAILKVKELMEPYYRKGVVNKIGWKVIVKRAVGKIQRYQDYYAQDGKIEILIQNYVKDYKENPTQ